MEEWVDENQILVDALETLLEHEVVDHNAAVGIMKQIIGDEGEVNLSEKQQYVYDRYVVPHLTPECEGHYCGGETINIEDLPHAYDEAFEVGGLWCEECITAHYRIQDQMAKDD